jgi:hypothetical protein
MITTRQSFKKAAGRHPPGFSGRLVNNWCRAFVGNPLFPKPTNPHKDAHPRNADPPRALLDDIPACAITLSQGDPDVDHG